MKILITGITGLFGSYLAKAFSNLGEIHGLKRKDSSTRLLEDCDFEIHWHEGDLNDPEAISSAIKDMDLVIHSAGMVSFDPKDKEALYEVNVQGTANVVNSMLSEGVNKLIYISSVAAIGRSSEISTVDESYKWTESPLNTDYSISKYGGELEAWRGEQEGLELIVVNPSVLLSKVEDDRSSTMIYKYLLEGRKYYPKGNVNYIDIRDAAEMVRQIFSKGKWGERFILNKESIPYQEFFNKMGEAFDLKAPSKQISNSLLNWVLFFQAFLSKLGLMKTVLNKQTAKIAQQEILFDNQKVNKLLEYEYRSLTETFLWAK